MLRLGLSKAVERRILKALVRYYGEEITLERAAEMADVSLWLFIDYIRKHNLPIVFSKKDGKRGLKAVLRLARRRGKEVFDYILQESALLKRR